MQRKTIVSLFVGLALFTAASPFVVMVVARAQPQETSSMSPRDKAFYALEERQARALESAARSLERMAGRCQ